MNKTQELKAFFKRQLEIWPEAAARYEALSQVQMRTVAIDDFEVRLQYNPARSLSSTAKLDKASIAARPCFLCKNNRPKEQVIYEGFDGFDTLVNPYPIFPEHFTIAGKQHVLQDTADFFRMAEIAASLPGFVVFFNGSTAGASAPDHLHFQAGNKDFLPVCALLENNPGELMKTTPEFSAFCTDNLPVYAVHFVSDGMPAEVNKWIDALVPDGADTVSVQHGMRNLLMWVDEDDKLHTLLFPRKKHRPECYSLSEEQGGLLVSPGAVDMAGVIIITRESDFHKIGKGDLRSIFAEVSYPYKESARFKNLMLL